MSSSSSVAATVAVAPRCVGRAQGCPMSMPAFGHRAPPSSSSSRPESRLCVGGAPPERVVKCIVHCLHVGLFE
eukprot:11200441-Lingulodinium_polyedra.AAC.1